MLSAVGLSVSRGHATVGQGICRRGLFRSTCYGGLLATQQGHGGGLPRTEALLRGGAEKVAARGNVRKAHATRLIEVCRLPARMAACSGKCSGSFSLCWVC